MTILVAIYLFVIGACFGSFAGAMAWRIEKRKNVVSERSECEYCHRTLAAKDLVPVMSWLSLRGKCRYCHKPIGYTAFLLELLLGVSFVVSYVCWPGGGIDSGLEWIRFVLWLIALVMLAILFVYDARHSLLPDVITYPLAGIGAALFISQLFLSGTSVGLASLEFLLALLPISGVYGFLYIVSKGQWVGLGDVKLGVFIGLALGWQAAFLALILSNLIGLVWVAPSLINGKRDRTAHVPFGPFLIIATFLAFVWGEQLMSWYLGLLNV